MTIGFRSDLVQAPVATTSTSLDSIRTGTQVSWNGGDNPNSGQYRHPKTIRSREVEIRYPKKRRPEFDHFGDVIVRKKRPPRKPKGQRGEPPVSKPKPKRKPKPKPRTRP